MRAIEALERLLAMATELTGLHPSQRPANDPDGEGFTGDDQTAMAICTAMVNTAIPIARFRVHVVIEEVSKGSKLMVSDYTICAVNTNGLKAALRSLWSEDANVDVSLWEQRPTGADMLAGYRGRTKDQRFRRFYGQLDHFQTAPTVQ